MNAPGNTPPDGAEPRAAIYGPAWMEQVECGWAEGEEPSATIYTPAWLDARERLVWIDDEDARGLLASAMEQVESGWKAVRAVQRWADRHPEPDRQDDEHGALLTFAESELQEVFRSMAFNLADVVASWPGRGLPPDNDIEAHRTEFGRYATVLVLATGAAVDVPDGFRAAVLQVARLLPGGEWARRLAETFAGIQDVSAIEIAADTARQAVDFLVHALPEPERERIGGLLVLDLANGYGAAGQPPPWLAVLRGFFGVSSEGNGRGRG